MTREKEQLKITKHNFKRPKRSSRNEKDNKVSRTRQKINKKVDIAPIIEINIEITQNILTEHSGMKLGTVPEEM